MDRKKKCMNRRTVKDDNNGSIIPIFYYVITLVVMGALFTLFFLEVFFPLTEMITISDSPYKTAIMFFLRGLLVIILVVCSLGLIVSGLKQRWGTVP